MDDLLSVKSDYLLNETCGGPTVREVHVDFLLQEEFSSDPNFLHAFIRAAGRSEMPLQPESVRHSVSDTCGEADLIVVYKQPESRKLVAILIEVKIRAIFQPTQPERYQERSKKGRNDGDWSESWTCLVAPDSYITPNNGFDAEVRLEQLKDLMAVGDTKRHEFKARVIQEAIDKAKNHGAQIVDETMTKFRRDYYALFTEFFASRSKDVFMKPPSAGVYKGESWFRIKSDRLLPKGAYVHHKSERGFVDLTFPDTDAGRLSAIEPYLEAGMEVVQTDKSSAIRLEVPKIRRFDCFDLEREAVVRGFAAVAKLLDFYVREHRRLDSILGAAA